MELNLTELFSNSNLCVYDISTISRFITPAELAAGGAYLIVTVLTPLGFKYELGNDTVVSIFLKSSV